MGLSCGAQCCKFILFAFNFIFWLAGAALLGLGIWLRVDRNVLSILEIAKIDSNDPLITIVSYVLIGIGAFVFLVGFLGCCGACQESPCMLWLYCFFLIIVMLAQIAAGILAGIYRNRLGDELRKGMANAHNKNYGQPGQDGFTRSWNAVQVSLRCCGVNGPADYSNSTWAKTSGGNNTIPDTCCKLSNTDSENPMPKDKGQCLLDYGNNVSKSEFLRVNGCYDEFFNWMQKHSVILIAVASAIAAIQIFGIVASCCLLREFKKN
ncbi:unnamed protein product [Owenia fusiformis]|uniref:Tetraspanin n=1 Tax=Owenia fusiformis TaxID=6347 RepID=A0A8J1TXJ7_OWEFU|nr:unnamed protein product [Owenia fusiformis]